MECPSVSTIEIVIWVVLFFVGLFRGPFQIATLTKIVAEQKLWIRAIEQDASRLRRERDAVIDNRYRDLWDDDDDNNYPF